MRTLLSLSAAVMLTASLAAEEALLTDGQRVRGTLQFASDRLRFQADDPARTHSPDKISFIRFDPGAPRPFLAGVTHQVTFFDHQRLSGELLRLDAEKVAWRSPWQERLTLERAALEGISSGVGRRIVLDESFEQGLASWSLQGDAAPTDRLATSGRHSLALVRPGQSAQRRFTPPLMAGTVSLNFHLPMATTGAKWHLEAEFGEERTPTLLRVTVAGPENRYHLEGPIPESQKIARDRQPGWHRLAVEYRPDALLVTVDEHVVGFHSEKGPPGGLRLLRLACVPETVEKETQRVSGEVAFDEVVVTTPLPSAPRPQRPPTRDEVWLNGGDQLYGRLQGADRKGVDWEGPPRPCRLTWGEVRGIFVARTPRPRGQSQGEHVRVTLRPTPGHEPDELEGVLTGFEERRLLLRHAVLGDLIIPREVLRQLRPLFRGARLDVETGLVNISAPEPLRRSWQARALPRDARLSLTLWDWSEPTIRTEVVLNGQVAEPLERHAGMVKHGSVRVTVPLSPQVIRKGENILEVRVVKGGGAVAVSDVRVDLVE